MTVIDRRPDGTDPDGFYRRVADRYAELVITTNAPARDIAAESGVPVTTVHRWIREARRRGHLAPARQGTVHAATTWTRVAGELGMSTERLRAAVERHAPGGLRP